MKKLAFAVFCVFISSIFGFGQTGEKAEVLAVVNKMFAEMKNHNPAEISALFQKDSNLTAIIKTKDGKTVFRAFTGETFSKNFAQKRGEIEEIMYKPQIEVFTDFAMVWGRYIFYTDSKITHCGVNSFHLVKTEAGWKIANASSTIEPQGCTEKEKKFKKN